MADRPPTDVALRPRPDLHLTADEQDLASAAVETFTAAIGGRERLLQALSVAGGTTEIDQIVRLLVDPRYASWSLRRICDKAGLTIAELFTAYKSALLTRAQIESTQVVAQRLVGVVDDVMRRAQPHPVPCEACGGSGQTLLPASAPDKRPEPMGCPTCQGKGTRIALPDLDRQKVALELGQLLDRRGGISIQQQTLVSSPSAAAAPGALEQLQLAVQEMLYPRAPVVDAETVPAAADARDPTGGS